MNPYRKALDRLDRFEGYLDTATYQMRQLFTPILKAVGVDRVCVEKVTIRGDICNIEYGWSHRGLTSGDDVSIPASLLDAEDPVQAATEWHNAEQARRAEIERVRRLAVAQAILDEEYGAQ